MYVSSMSQGFLPFVFGCVCIFIIGLESCVHEKYVHPVVLLFTFQYPVDIHFYCLMPFSFVMHTRCPAGRVLCFSRTNTVHQLCNLRGFKITYFHLLKGSAIQSFKKWHFYSEVEFLTVLYILEHCICKKKMLIKKGIHHQILKHSD